MEALLIIMEELKRERAQLLAEKQANETMLATIEEKIRQYQALIRKSKIFVSVYNRQITSYQNLLTFERVHSQNLLFTSKRLESVYESNIDSLQSKIKQEKRAQKRYLICHDYWVSEENHLRQRNLEITEDLQTLEAKINSYQAKENPKVYSLGGIKDGRIGNPETGHHGVHEKS